MAGIFIISLVLATRLVSWMEDGRWMDGLFFMLLDRSLLVFFILATCTTFEHPLVILHSWNSIENFHNSNIGYKRQ